MILLILLFLINPAAHSATVMNGYSLGQFGNFEKDWKLVTVRYRKDTGEMRFTYANDLAWKALQENSRDYPQGAVFAKVGLATIEDPAFTSSMVPGGARRVQFMVRNKSLHAATDGWGYALFDSKGNTFPSSPANTDIACAACHRLVPDRGYVFSQVMGTVNPNLDRDSWRANISFANLSSAEIPKKMRALLPAGAKTLRSLQGDLRKNLFSGTLDEVRPLLAMESVASGQSAALISEDGKLFSLVVSDPSGKCSTNEIALKGFHTVPNPSKPIFSIKFCEPASKPVTATNPPN